MAFFNLFSKRKSIELGLEELEAWLNMQISAKNLDQRITKSKRAFDEHKKRALDAITRLEQASLHNDNIPVKDKQIMDGHRRTYVHRMRRFFEGLNAPIELSEVGHFTAVFSESLSSLAQETHKNQAILRHFFDQEVSNLSSSIRDMQSELSSLQSEIDKAGVELVKEAMIRLKQYRQDLERKDELESQKAAKESEIETLRSKSEKIEKRLAELKASQDYNQFSEVLYQKKQLEESLGGIEQELITIFSELNRPLKKFTHDSPNERLVDHYISDPVGALEDDASLVIHEILSKMDESIDSLELKDKQLDKAKEMVMKLSRDYLNKTRLEIARLKSLNKDLATQINRSVVALNISENESWLKSLLSKTSHHQKDLDLLDSQIEGINPNYLYQKIRDKVKEIDANVNLREP